MGAETRGTRTQRSGDTEMVFHPQRPRCATLVDPSSIVHQPCADPRHVCAIPAWFVLTLRPRFVAPVPTIAYD
eukprot:11165839-Lingulodinium_polyedra.AAC.1